MALAVVSAAKSQEFEVASIKPAVAPSIANIPIEKGGPGTNDPGRIYYSTVSLKGMIVKAYGLYFDQVSGPDWLGQVNFALTATLPPDTTKRQLGTMLQNLLATRFGLTFHWDEGEFTVYALEVAKGGAKLKPSVPLNADDAAKSEIHPVIGQFQPDRDGCPMIPPDVHASAGTVGAHGCQSYSRSTMEELAQKLSLFVALQEGIPVQQISWANVVDRTGLTGEFDFTLKINLPPLAFGLRGGATASTASDPRGPDLFRALQDQLGLKLEKSKVKLPVMKVDHAEKVPSEN